jgi:flagellar hook protein FlgE
MSLLTSLSSGASGLSSASSDLSIIGDNIANANTVGFKAERGDFEDELAQSVIGGTGEIGLGSQLASVQKIFTQGSLQNTGVPTDLALQGSGFFEVAGTTADGRTGTYLTRAGQFTVDSTGYLVNQNGLRVQGYGADASGTLSSAVGDLQVGNASAAPSATTQISMKANLQADATIPAAAWDPTQASATSNFSSSATVYDSLGKATQVQVYFRRTGSGTWDYHALVDGSTVQGGTAGTPVEIATGSLAFDAQGQLQSTTQGASNFSPLNANPQPLTFNFGDPIASGGTGLAGVTQFSAASVATFVGQDGYGSGQLTSVQVDSTGTIQGVFTNGQTRTLGQVGVARVASPELLQRIGGNLYAVTGDSGNLTLDSGQAVMGAAGQGGRAFIASGSLEQSNVDIADQFVQMIAAQRSFEANSKTITTADQLLSELIAMKR